MPRNSRGNSAIPSIEEWDKMGKKEMIEVAKNITSSHPDFKFVKLEKFALGKVSHNIALFENERREYSFLPGGKLRLGYDRNKFMPTKAQAESWKETEEEFLITLDDFMKFNMTKPRSAVLPPMLVERSISIANAEKNGNLTCEYPTTAKKWQRTFPKGFRLLTSDEWEHACGAGAATLFRWGDDCPTDCYPIDKCKFDLHSKPNAFGLSIAQDPYNWELCIDAMRGGDGGCMICGGAGFFAGWLTLATAFVDHGQRDWYKKMNTGAYYRMAYEL